MRQKWLKGNKGSRNASCYLPPQRRPAGHSPERHCGGRGRGGQWKRWEEAGFCHPTHLLVPQPVLCDPPLSHPEAVLLAHVLQVLLHVVHALGQGVAAGGKIRGGKVSGPSSDCNLRHERKLHYYSRGTLYLWQRWCGGPSSPRGPYNAGVVSGPESPATPHPLPASRTHLTHSRRPFPRTCCCTGTAA